MLKKIIASCMVYSLLFTSVLAETNSLRSQSLNNIFEKMNYQLAVLWDQKNIEFYNKIILDFEDAIEAEKENGLTSSELLQFIKSKVVNAEDKKDFQTIINQFEGNLSEEDAQDLIGDYKKSIRATGTNWVNSSSKSMVWVSLSIMIFIGTGIGVYYVVRDID